MSVTLQTHHPSSGVCDLPPERPVHFLPRGRICLRTQRSGKRLVECGSWVWWHKTHFLMNTPPKWSRWGSRHRGRGWGWWWWEREGTFSMEEKDQTKRPRTKRPSQDSPNSCSVPSGQEGSSDSLLPWGRFLCRPLENVCRGVSKILEQLGVSVLSPHLPPCLTLSSVSTPRPPPSYSPCPLSPFSSLLIFIGATVYFLRWQFVITDTIHKY